MQTHLLSPQKSPKKKPLLSKGELLTELKINPQAKHKNDRKDNKYIHNNQQDRFRNNRPAPVQIPNNIRNSQVVNRNNNNSNSSSENANALDGLLQQSQKLVRKQKLAYDKIKNGKQQIEKKVYGAATNSREEYLSNLYDQVYHQNQYVSEGLQQVIDDVNRDIAQDINKKNLKIHKKISITKDDLPELQKLDKFRLLKIKDGQVKNKVGNLRHQMQAEYLRNKNKRKFNTIDVLQKDYYDYSSPRRKKNQSFVRKLKQEKQEHLRKKDEYLMAKQQEQMRKREQQSFLKEQERRKRHQQLKQKYEEQAMKLMEAARVRKEHQQEFKIWKNYYEQEKPLYVKKEQQFYVKHQIPKMQQMKQQLMRRKAMNHPIDLQQIQDHQKQYIDYKNDDKIRRKAEIQMLQQQQQQRIQQMNQRLYKGKARYLVLKDMLEKRTEQDPKQINRDKKIRQLAYSQDLRYKARLKNQTIQQLSAKQSRKPKVMVTRIRNAQGSMILSNQGENRSRKLSFGAQSQLDPMKPYQEGIKNLVFVKKMVRQHANNDAVKPHIRLLQQRQQKPNYLAQLKQKRKHISLSKSVQRDIQQTKDHQTLQSKMKHFDQRVKQKQLQEKYRSTKEEKDHVEIEEGYLASIKAKLKLLTKFD